MAPTATGAVDDREYASLRKAIVRAVRRACPAWLVSHHEDIAQIAITKIAAVLEGGKPLADLSKAYVARVAYNAVVDEIRKQRRRHALSAVDDAPEDLPDAQLGQHKVLEGRQLGLAIKDCFADMAQTRRVAVGLYLEGRGATEIAKMFEWKRKQADNLVYRGLADLRKCLEGKGYERD